MRTTETDIYIHRIYHTSTKRNVSHSPLRILHQRGRNEHKAHRLIVPPQQRRVVLVKVDVLASGCAFPHPRGMLRLAHDDLQSDELVCLVRHRWRPRGCRLTDVVGQVGRGRGRGVGGGARSGILRGGDEEIDDSVRYLLDVLYVYLELAAPVARLAQCGRYLVCSVVSWSFW